ncbi:MAG: RagB/SusD family nutrient uptake outer membrane protein [Cyclobacteriaceae bacterium]
MKSYKYIWSIICLLAGMFSSCNDDFLERFPLDEVSNETFWNTENDLATYNNTFYHMALNDNEVPIMVAHHDGFNSLAWSYYFQDEFADNLAPRHERHLFFQQVRAGKQIVPNSAQWFGYSGWNFVRALNIGLENYGKAAISEEARNKYIGEARLFRGWFYAEKVQKFGDVPWVDHELNIDDEALFAARTPREEAMDNVLADLEFATTHIPDDWGDGNEPGRLNRWAALAVMSRVCLFEGTWRKYHGGTNPEMWLRAAADAAKEIMDNGPYAIYNTGDPENDYNAFHRVLDLSGNPEVMVWRRYQLGI